MNNDEGTTRERDKTLEGLAAVVTDAAYAVALRHGVSGSWVDLELGLWKSLTQTIREWSRNFPDVPSNGISPSDCGSNHHWSVSSMNQEQE